ncbi:hypothetical protein BBJ28_00019987 [Nothophytophthora sp. Chile5]|nr:hypothetical protein BBJ28_00019987 [Nothophytophthora sp. Chile5]
MNARHSKSEALELSESRGCSEGVARGKAGLGKDSTAFCDEVGRVLMECNDGQRQSRSHGLAASVNDARTSFHYQRQIETHHHSEENEKDVPAASEYILYAVLPSSPAWKPKSMLLKLRNPTTMQRLLFPCNLAIMKAMSSRLPFSAIFDRYMDISEYQTPAT